MSTTIEKYIDLQHEILSDFSENWDSENAKITFREAVKNYYSFESNFGWNIMLNAYYVFSDTELAKSSFQQFGLQGPSRHRDVGEKYLRLYGILSSIYQQKIAIENLIEIFKLPNLKTIRVTLNNIELIKLRNKISSHPSNYSLTQDDSEHKFDVYEISRGDLIMDRINLLRNQDIFEDIDLKIAINEFNKLIENLLEQITQKFIKKKFNNQGKYYEKLKMIKLESEGVFFINDTVIKF